MNIKPLEPEALGALCDVLDEYPDTLRLILPHDYERVADLVHIGPDASALIVATADADEALQHLAAAGLRYEAIPIDGMRESMRLLVRSERPAQYLIRVAA